MWDKKTVALLIIKYQEHENLYNVKNPLYDDRDKRSESFFEICKKLKELNNEITVEDIKKKIHTLRTQYIKESREISRMERSEPKLWCYNQLNFLRHHCTKRKINLNYSNIYNSEKNNKKEEDLVHMESELADDLTGIAVEDNSVVIKSEPVDNSTNKFEEEFSFDVKNEALTDAESGLEVTFSIEIKNEAPVDINTEYPAYLTSNSEKDCSTDINSESQSYVDSNMEKKIHIDINKDHTSTPSCSKKKKPLNLEERIKNLRSLLAKRLREKSDFDWLGKQVVFEMKAIKNKKIQQDTAWMIQNILRDAAIEDAKASKLESEKRSSTAHVESQLKFATLTSNEKLMCSSISPPSSFIQQLDLVHKSESYSCVSFPLVQPPSIALVNSCNANTSELQPQNNTVKEEFQCL